MGSAFSAVLLSGGVQRLQPVSAATPTLEATLASPRDIDESFEVCSQPVTHAYPAEGWFTGVRSSVVVPQSPAIVYDSLSRDLQDIFEPIVECKDTVKEGSGDDVQRLHRLVRIPFTISYFSGNIHLKLAVENNRSSGQISFKSIGQGRFLSRFEATFLIRPSRGPKGLESTSVQLDSRLVVKRLPPPPLKSLVKGVVVRKMDRCMQDLAAFHTTRLQDLGSSPGARLANNIQPTLLLKRLMSTERRGERPSIL